MQRTIDASATVTAPLGRVREVLVDDPGAALKEHVSADERRARRFHSVLSVGAGAGATLQQEVVIEVGAPRLDGEALIVRLAWRASGRSRLLPSFAGKLRVSPDRAGTLLELNGAYVVPLGVIGRFGDDLAGHRIACRSLAAFLEQMAERLDVEVDRRLRSVPSRHGPEPVSIEDSGP
jgi:hypothetical protein